MVVSEALSQILRVCKMGSVQTKSIDHLTAAAPPAVKNAFGREREREAVSAFIYCMYIEHCIRRSNNPLKTTKRCLMLIG